jgi:hypothetical protein
MAVGMLAFLSGANVASAVLTGVRAFAGAALLLLALLVFLDWRVRTRRSGPNLLPF